MSNTIINWRFWSYHLQVTRPRDWRWRRRGDIIRWSHNPYHAPGRYYREQRDWPRVDLIAGAGYAWGALALIALLIWWAL